MKKTIKDATTTVGLVLLGVACGQGELKEEATRREAPQGDPIQGTPIQGAPIEVAETTPEVPPVEMVEKTEVMAEEVVEAVSEAPVEVVVSAPEAGTTVEPEPVALSEAPEELEPEGKPTVVNESVADTIEAAFDSATEKMEAARASAVEELEKQSLEVLSAPDTALAEAAASAGATSMLKRLADGTLDVSFDRLASFDYEMPEDLTVALPGESEGSSDQIPQAIRDLNDQAIALKGFMLPLKVEEGLVTEMLIMRDQSMCCYGTVPKINEWVSVRMDEGKGVKPVMDEAVTLFGKLKVGEIRENGYLVGIYEMNGDRMKGPDDE